MERDRSIPLSLASLSPSQLQERERIYREKDRADRAERIRLKRREQRLKQQPSLSRVAVSGGTHRHSKVARSRQKSLNVIAKSIGSDISNLYIQSQSILNANPNRKEPIVYTSSFNPKRFPDVPQPPEQHDIKDSVFFRHSLEFANNLRHFDQPVRIAGFLYLYIEREREKDRYEHLSDLY